MRAVRTSPSYLGGTRIRTDRGAVPIEDLRIGDKAITLDGTAKPIKWIGRRTLEAAEADDILVIRQGAIGDNIPDRDLYVSPTLALFFDDVLVEAGKLVNGASVAPCPDIGSARYFHIELDRHDIVFAEGAPAETFVDCDTSDLFENGASFALLYPGEPRQRWMFCAPRLEGGAALDQIRRAIDARAGLVPQGGADVAPGPLDGQVDGLDGNTIGGWAFDRANPDTAVVLEVLDGEILVARMTANRFRADLAAAGIGDGRHGFALLLSRSLSPLVRHALRVRRVSDGRDLAGSPLTIEAHERRSPMKDTRQAIEMAVNTPSDPATLDALLETLLQGVDRVRRLKAADTAGTGNHRSPPRLRSKRALVIDDLLPRANRDAGSNAILSHITALQTLGWAVEFVASGELAGGDNATEALRALGVTCHRSPVIASVEEVLRRNRNMFELVYLHRLANAEGYAPLVRIWQQKARIVYCVADLHHVRAARQASVHGNNELMETAAYLKARELRTMGLADVTITHSTAEAEYLSREAPGVDVRVVPWALTAAPRTVPFAERRGIAFVGGMRHAPNPDAVRWLAAEVLPLVWEREPDIECLLVGADWPEAVWGRLDPRLRLTGPAERLAVAFDRVRLTVAPLRFGAGVKGKVLDSFAHGLPCVMSPIAAEGIPLTPLLASAVGRDAVQMAALIRDLHASAALNEAHGQAGLDLVRSVFTEAAVTALMEAIAGSGVVQRTG